ncbi:cupin-like domain-containing protein [Novosphingobium mangrovi (ex Huang et al. 2023)]|uniref:Cupin-like domain-containing protein n=1 Tax=Novosphingobium mangrovi (ex Huang et al. 2023) TaxID=2976432 RepID=A0ABT2I1I6_9SPHN|nr:cupin-like domain-containing protein [Novosphingobium mangrovi (ex Huang et al. 2023)]MCT2398665.1 cupin-like domain-containing protein [Novosphingobium mangrovi (ex Huang et al. 2023)]
MTSRPDNSDFLCYVAPGWEPRIRAASSKRDWMDAAPESFPYRCLPLAIANSHGWEILSPCGFEVVWNGGVAPEDVTVRADEGAREHEIPVALFGLGSFTIHVQGLFRTPPGWNLYVSGPPNAAKDGAVPLAGIVETDWSPYTFTMNWRLTRPGHPVRFEENEPIAQIFPVERGAIEKMQPRVVPLSDNPELEAEFRNWSHSRDAFQARVAANPPDKPADKWQKLYYRGLMPGGRCPVADHQGKLHVPEFANAPAIPETGAVASIPPQNDQEALRQAQWKIAKYEWLLETLEQQRALTPTGTSIFRCQDVPPDEFLEHFYAPGRPVVLTGLLEDWPALYRWTPQYLRERIGEAQVECQAGRSGNARFELDKEAHAVRMPFSDFIDAISAAQGNDLYLTAFNSRANGEALAPLEADIGRIDSLLDHPEGSSGGMVWIGPAGTFTPLHHDLTNNLLVQIVGRKQVILLPPSDTPKLQNDVHVFSAISDVADPALDRKLYPHIGALRTYEIILEPGEALFLPLGWWHQVRSLDFSVSMTFTNFRWSNAGYRGHPVAPWLAS